MTLSYRKENFYENTTLYKLEKKSILEQSFIRIRPLIIIFNMIILSIILVSPKLEITYVPHKNILIFEK